MNNVNSIEIILKNGEIKEYSNIRYIGIVNNEQELVIYKDYTNFNKDTIIHKKIVIFVDNIIGYSLISKEEK